VIKENLRDIEDSKSQDSIYHDFSYLSRDESPASERGVYTILKDIFSRKARELLALARAPSNKGAFVLFGVLFAAQHDDP